MTVWPPLDGRDDAPGSLADQVAARIVPVVENHFLGLARRIEGLENRFARLEEAVQDQKPIVPDPLKQDLGEAIVDAEGAVHEHLEDVQDHLGHLETMLDGLVERLEGMESQIDDLADEVSALAIRTGGQKSHLSDVLDQHLARVRREIVEDLLSALARGPLAHAHPPDPDQPSAAPTTTDVSTSAPASGTGLEPTALPQPDPETAPGDEGDGASITVEVRDMLTPDMARQAGKDAWAHDDPMQHLEKLVPGSTRAGLNGTNPDLWRSFLEGTCNHLPGQGSKAVGQAFNRLAPALKHVQAWSQRADRRTREHAVAPIANALVDRLTLLLGDQPPSREVLAVLQRLAGPGQVPGRGVTSSAGLSAVSVTRPAPSFEALAV